METIFPSLDVIVPCYNEEREIAACLDALLGQAGELSSIIVVDNNSTDGTKAIIDRYRAQYPEKIIYVFEQTPGLPSARNRGFAESKADIMARIDADTRVGKAWARAIRQFYAGHPHIAAATGSVEYYDLPFRRLTSFITWLFMYAINEVTSGSIGLYGANMSLKRDAWERIKDSVKMNTNIMEDLSITIALNNAGYSCVRIPEAFAQVSGRRMRTSPRQFAKYNMQWPRTYALYGKKIQAFFTRIAAIIGILFQIPAAFLLQYHDARTGKFGFRKVSNYEERSIT